MDETVDVSSVYEHDGPVHYRRDYYGLRGVYGQPRDISLLVIGNSVTDQRLVSEGETWPDLLNACLNRKGMAVKTANAGVSGQSVQGHVNNFDLWFSKIQGLQPKWVLAYVGVTDVAYQGNDDSDDVRRYHETVTSPTQWENARKWLRMNSAINKVVADVRLNLKMWRKGRDSPSPSGPVPFGQRADQAVERHVSETRGRAMLINSPDYSALKTEIERQMQNDLVMFQLRLEKLDDRISAFGAQPIFVTQSASTYRSHDGLIWGDVRYFIRLRFLADRVMRVCQNRQRQCLDLSADLFLENGDSYDGSHLTSSGSLKISDFMCERLRLE